MEGVARQGSACALRAGRVQVVSSRLRAIHPASAPKLDTERAAKPSVICTAGARTPHLGELSNTGPNRSIQDPIVVYRTQS